MRFTWQCIRENSLTKPCPTDVHHTMKDVSHSQLVCCPQKKKVTLNNMASCRITYSYRHIQQCNLWYKYRWRDLVHVHIKHLSNFDPGTVVGTRFGLGFMNFLNCWSPGISCVLSYHSLNVSSYKSGHCPLNSLINKQLLPLDRSSGFPSLILNKTIAGLHPWRSAASEILKSVHQAPTTTFMVCITEIVFFPHFRWNSQGVCAWFDTLHCCLQIE